MIGVSFVQCDFPTCAKLITFPREAYAQPIKTKASQIMSNLLFGKFEIVTDKCYQLTTQSQTY